MCCSMTPQHSPDACEGPLAGSSSDCEVSAAKILGNEGRCFALAAQQLSARLLYHTGTSRPIQESDWRREAGKPAGTACDGMGCGAVGVQWVG